MRTDQLPAAPDVRSTTASLALPALRLAFGLLVLCQLALVVFTWWEPAPDGSVTYDEIADLGSAYWPANVLVGGPAFALTFITTSLFLVVLGAGRGRWLVLVGATLNLVGGLVFSLAITAEVLPFAWALEGPGAEAQVESLNQSLDGHLPYVVVPMAVVAIGVLLALSGVARSGGLPWWVVLVATLLVVLLFAVPPDLPGAIAVDIAQRVLWIYVGWRALQVAIKRG